MYLKHLLKAIRNVSTFVMVVGFVMAWVGSVFYLFLLQAWWSIALGTILCILTIAVPVGTMDYLDERDRIRLRVEMDALRSHRDA